MGVERLGILQLRGFSRWGCNSMVCEVFSLLGGEGPKSSGALDGILDFCSERWVSWIRLGYFLRTEGDVFHYCSGRTVLYVLCINKLMLAGPSYH